MDSRIDLLNRFYGKSDEDNRLCRNRHGQLEFATTMYYIRKYAPADARILEVGAGTGRYSIALAKEGRPVTAVELVESNLNILKENGTGLSALQAFQGDATDLSRFADDSFDVTLVLGPLYHLYEKADVHKAIDEAIRVTKPGGIVMCAFLSVYAIMYVNYYRGNWKEGMAENFTSDYAVRHFEEQLFTGYDIVEFENLFREKNVEWITTAATDGILEAIEKRDDFIMTDEEFAASLGWHIHCAEKRELLGASSHLLHICRVKRGK
ncbi:MAG: class I SAM-dependent methyltransferase [Treponemataceae bacterium]|nr:class I SAM-dependent methyltransferase [Treponemataceae bacterium]